MSRPSARILVAAESVGDATLVRKLVGDEFDDVHVNVDATSAAADFERHQPDVLVVAFNEIEKAERYYLGLYRLSRRIHAMPHRTVILCRREDVLRVYELCRREYFDDYVLFWPMTHDAPRLRMAIHHALRQLAAGRDATAARAAEFAAQARRIADLEAQVASTARHGEQHVERVSRSLHEAGEQIDAALDGFSRRLAGGDLRGLLDVRDPGGLEGEWARLRAERIAPPLRSASEAVAPVRRWIGELQRELAPHIESARVLNRLADRVRFVVLLVDDDVVQHRLVAQLLADQPIDLVTAASGTDALGVLRLRMPDLVLMDIELPELDGVEVTRRLKAVPEYAALPIVMVTGHSDREQVVKSLKAGAVDFLVKPFDRERLLAKLSRHLGVPAP